jgi:hypothetical protein
MLSRIWNPLMLGLKMLVYSLSLVIRSIFWSVLSLLTLPFSKKYTLYFETQGFNETGHIQPKVFTRTVTFNIWGVKKLKDLENDFANERKEIRINPFNYYLEPLTLIIRTATGGMWAVEKVTSRGTFECGDADSQKFDIMDAQNCLFKETNTKPAEQLLQEQLAGATK